jgi:adenylosuccinate lyase
MFDTPIGSRYSHSNLETIWSNVNKIKLMRDLWSHLAIFQKELGIHQISTEGIIEMQENRDAIIMDDITKYEIDTKHDIVANIHAFGDLCPHAKSFIHLGATSNFINDNVDLIRIRDSLIIIKEELYVLFSTLKDLSFKFIDLPTVAYTHLQKAQLTTVGKRFTMWNNDIFMDIEELINLIDLLPFKGMKGTVGSEDTLLKLFNDKNKCNELNKKLAQQYNFDKNLLICGQTYSRKYDVKVVNCLSNIAQTLYKIMSDFRLLSSKMEIIESFGENQVGSSAMPYKKNPITCEKICSLSRYIMNNQNNMSNTYINQWLERSLDDSAIKRIVLPETFVLLGYLIQEANSVFKTCVVNESIIKQNVKEHMGNIISEKVIIEGVKRDYNRQNLHEKLRNCQVNNKSIYEDPILKFIIEHAFIIKDPREYTGLCKEQVRLFYEDVYKLIHV